MMQMFPLGLTMTEVSNDPVASLSRRLQLLLLLLLLLAVLSSSCPVTREEPSDRSQG